MYVNLKALILDMKIKRKLGVEKIKINYMADQLLFVMHPLKKDKEKRGNQMLALTFYFLLRGGSRDLLGSS